MPESQGSPHEQATIISIFLLLGIGKKAPSTGKDCNFSVPLHVTRNVTCSDMRAYTFYLTRSVEASNFSNPSIPYSLTWVAM